jgi:hypothetical protein
MGTARTAWHQCDWLRWAVCETVAVLESVGLKFYVISINPGAVIVEVSGSHRHATLTADIHAAGGIRTRNPSK